MTKEEKELALLILDNVDLPLRIEVRERMSLPYDYYLRDFRDITLLQSDYGIYLDDYYYIKSQDFDSFTQYVVANTPLNTKIPNESEIREQYDSLPWEEIIYVVLDRQQEESD